jgi:hypothetical protein
MEIPGQISGANTVVAVDVVSIVTVYGKSCI